MNNEPTNVEIIAVADTYAAVAHTRVGQKRKFAEPAQDYIVHPRQTAAYLANTIHNDAITIAVALNHDVLEDTLKEGQNVGEAAEEMRCFFTQRLNAQIADRIVAGVLEVTDVAKPEDGNRATRMGINRDHAAKASPEQQTVKCADIKSNMPSIVKFNPGFARKWVAEKKAVVDLLTQADPVLRAEVLAMIQAYYDGTFNPDAYEIV